jgi:hypothetical protein
MIEEGIRPLVEALNRLPYATTIYSCEGHFDAPPNEKFLPTAYVTFDVNEPDRFRLLYRDLASLSSGLESGSIRLTYDCILGRYTLSAWPDPGLRSARDKREAVGALVERLTRVALEQLDGRVEPSVAAENDTDPNPCGHGIPPCALTIPATQIACPFRNEQN